MHQKMITRRVRKGFNAAESTALLYALIAAHEGDNLVHALVYNEFATEYGAELFISVHGAE